jgi:hypothetical protein
MRSYVVVVCLYIVLSSDFPWDEIRWSVILKSPLFPRPNIVVTCPLNLKLL